ncbi:hypothetical protein D3C72_1642450 [compost metagenome]
MRHDICEALNFLIGAAKIPRSFLDTFFKMTIEFIDILPRPVQGTDIGEDKEDRTTDHNEDSERTADRYPAQLIGSPELIRNDDAQAIICVRLQVRQNTPDLVHEAFAVIITDDLNRLRYSARTLQIDGLTGFSQLRVDCLPQTRKRLLVLLVFRQKIEKS